MNLRSRSLYAIARPSVCRLSRVHERYRNTTDGRAMIAYSERTELAKGHAEKKIILCARDSISSEQDAVSFPVSLRGLRTNVNVSSRSLKKLLTQSHTSAFSRNYNFWASAETYLELDG